MKFEIDKTYTNNLGAKVALLYRTGNNLAFIGAMGVYYTDLEGQCADPGKSVQPPLKFEIGKHYTTKLGHKVRLDAMVQGRLVFKAAEHAYRTTMDGKSVWGHMDVVEEWKEPQAPLKLEVGKYYKTRSGSKVRVVEIRERSLSHTPVTLEVYIDKAVFPRACPLNGQWLLRNEEHPFNIVEEWKEPPLKLEVGKTYLTRGGSKVLITDVARRSSTVYPVEVKVLTGDNVGQRPVYTSKGSYYHNTSESPKDIISEWVEPVAAPVLKLEVGKTYNTRGGSKVKLTQFTAGNIYCFEGESWWPDGSRAGSCTYTKLGEVIAGAKDRGWNIISEGTSSSTKPPLKLEVGKYYKTRDGYPAQVVHIGAMHSSHTVVALVFDKTNPTTPVTRSYTPQGQWAVNLQESSHDLIAEYPWPKSEKLKPLEEGDIVVATTKSGDKVVRVFAGYSGEKPTVYKDGYFEGQTAGNWASVELLMKGKDA